MEHGHFYILRGLFTWPTAREYATDEDESAIFLAGSYVYVECRNNLHARHEKVRFFIFSFLL